MGRVRRKQGEFYQDVGFEWNFMGFVEKNLDFMVLPYGK